MKNLKKVLALVLAVVMIMGVVTVASAKTYTDVKATDDYATAIDILSNLKILDGFKDGDNYSFKSGDKFTRAQAAKIVAIVHNAATNGKIKDQTAISALYSNAQNPFVDCNSSWALPFINYCRITGLADGMTTTTYEPNRYVTGVQFLKLMLTTLNFDTAKEGYTGTGWDVNVLNRANEIGLTAGLKDGWKAIAPITRGEAAQVLYNALTAYLVEYGQNIKAYNPEVKAGTFLTKAFVANESVASTGVMLAAKMGIGITRTTDKFRRPGYTWSYGTWTGFYMDTPKAEYKTAVTECEILKAMGVAENDNTPVTLNGWVDGKTTGTGATKVGKKIAEKPAYDSASTALNYYAVDGFKYTTESTASFVTLQHKTNHSCQLLADKSWKAPFFGGQGDLTQVFKTEDGWVVTTIHTFLANVDKVYKNNKYTHATGETADLTVYASTKAADLYDDEHPFTMTKTGIEEASFAAGTKVLVTITLKDNESNNAQPGAMSFENARSNLSYGRYGKIKDITAADSKTGKLTGASGINQAETVSIDGTKYPAACRFVLGKDDALNIANNGNASTFYFDSYGNVIGRVAVTDAKNYAVMDKIYAFIDKGVFTIKADLYGLNGEKIGDDVTVSHKAGSFKDFGRAMDETTAAAKEISIYEEANDVQLTDALYTYTVDEKGVYTLTLAGDSFKNVMQYGTNASWFQSYAYGRYSNGLYHAAKVAYLRIFDGNNNVSTYNTLNLTEATKFVVKHGTKWESYTGYTALPAMSATYVDFELDTDGYASIVYIGNAVYEGDNFTGFVPSWKSFRWLNVGDKAYAQVDVYVDGELKTVNVKPEATFDMFGTDHVYNLTNGNEPGTGMYKFYTQIDENDNVYVTFAYETRYLLAQGYAKVSSTSNDVTAFTVGTDPRAFNVTGTTIYLVKADGTMEKVDSSYIDDAYVVVYGDKDNLDIAVTIYAFAPNAEHPAH